MGMLEMWAKRALQGPASKAIGSWKQAKGNCAYCVRGNDNRTNQEWIVTCMVCPIKLYRHEYLTIRLKKINNWWKKRRTKHDLNWKNTEIRSRRIRDQKLILFRKNGRGKIWIKKKSDLWMDQNQSHKPLPLCTMLV